MNSSFAARLAAVLVSTLLVLAACETISVRNAAAQTAPPDFSGCAPKEFSVYFDEWQAELTPDARAAIASVQSELEGCVVGPVRIIGQAGARGDETDNLNISMARAEAIAAELENGGWPAAILELVAIGEDGATREDGVNSPMRRRAYISIQAAPPAYAGEPVS